MVLRKLAAVAAALTMLFGMARADSAPAWEFVPGLVCPGEKQVFLYSLPAGETAAVRVLDQNGNTVLTLDGQASGGSFEWDGEGLEPGIYTLQLECGMLSVQAALMVGAPVPGLEIVSADETAAPSWSAVVKASMDGVVTGTLEDGTGALRQEVQAGRAEISFSADGLATGEHTLSLRLEADGEQSAIQTVSFTVRQPSGATDTTYYTPSDMTGVTCDHDVCYWKLNMGEMNEENIWQVLTQPITVLEGSERHQVKARLEPDENCTTYTGEVTCESQAVHVLERGETWTLIQAYSSSVEASSVKVYAKPFTGYVKTSLLKERNVSQHTGIVIDKLQQRLYLFVDGHLYSTLLCSTGFSKKDTPFNETPAGEFVVQSWTGGFWSGSLWCDYGIRINDGILLHEVPVLVTYADDGSEIRNEERCEQYLGEKASHGCIRIQRKQTPEGVNMKWLWDNLDRGASAPTKVIIWDEVGRVLGYPDDGLTLYYNPKGGRYYHSQAQCEGVKSAYWPLTAFTYGQLSEKPYSKLTPCPYCAPQLTHDGVDTVNKKNTRSY